jgi:arylsulfatase A-like enzyme
MRVVVVSARGLQARLLGLYGNLWIETPSLDALAAAGVVFDHHFAGRADAAGARRSWRTGRHHLPVPGEQPTEAGEGPDLLAALRAGGIPTCLILDDSRPAVPGFEVGPAFAVGWDEVVRIEAGDGEAGSPLERAVSAAEAALARWGDRDGWLLWLDLATVLPPWDLPDEFLAPYFAAEPAEDEGEEEEEEDEEEEQEELLTPMRDVAFGPVDPADDALFLSLQSSCAAAVSYLDAGVGRLLEALREVKGGEEIVVAFTADCGLPLGEHGVVGLVRAFAHEEVIHVPLVLCLPQRLSLAGASGLCGPVAGASGLCGPLAGASGLCGRRVDALTQAADLAPTLAELFGVSLAEAQGHSLLPLARGQAERVRDYACAGVPVGDAIEWCLRTPEWAFLLPASAEASGRGPQLYVKPDDRGEVNNVIQHHLDFAERLERSRLPHATEWGLT